MQDFLYMVCCYTTFDKNAFRNGLERRFVVQLLTLFGEVFFNLLAHFSLAADAIVAVISILAGVWAIGDVAFHILS